MPALLLALPVAAESQSRDRILPRLEGGIAVDGELTDPAWGGALVVDEFYEISPGDNTPPVVPTKVLVGYDERFLYVAFHCYDRRPEEIRAVLSERDSVFGDQDFVQFDLDTHNDDKSSFIFRVNPRGVKGDAIFSEATGLDDFSPDFSFEAQGRIVEDGWIAEFRVPLYTLRYSDSAVQTWGVTFYRNYPRQFRRQMTSLPIPRGANCWLCYDLKLTEIRDLPPSRYTLLIPYTTFLYDSAGTSGSAPVSWMGGVDLKWIPRNSLTLDATYNPDFAQVEADQPQISVNRRFALFFPEKRSFFLEGADLLATPLAAVSTRSVTSPAWGARMTGRFRNAAYTFLLTEDEGGGTRIIPGPVSSQLEAQEGRSLAAIGRLRYSLGDSFAGFLFTDREEGKRHNRVFGPDLLWRPTETSQIAAQFLVSQTALHEQRAAADSALSLDWRYSTPSRFFEATYQRLGPDFRADNGFLPQVGIDRQAFSGGGRFYPESWFHLVEVGFSWDRTVEIGDRSVSRSTYPTILFGGKWNSEFRFEYHFREQVRTEAELLNANYLAFDFRIQPSRLLSTLELRGTLGQQVDFVNDRLGKGGSLSVLANLRPGVHFDTVLSLEHQWLNLQQRRLFTADALQLKQTFNFTARMFLRAIAQYERTEREPELYTIPIGRREGAWLGSILYGYRFNWQTVLYAGYSSNRSIPGQIDSPQRESHFFLKIAYAFEP